MKSRSTAVYRYHGIFETVYYRRAFPNTAHPYTVDEANEARSDSDSCESDSSSENETD